MSASEPVWTLNEAIRRAGYYPGLVTTVVSDHLEGHESLAYLVHVETEVAPEQLHQRMTVLVLTDTMLMATHVYDCSAEDCSATEVFEQQNAVHVVTESVAIENIRSVIVDRMYRQPEQNEAPGGVEPKELRVTIAWSGGGRLDVHPATDLGGHSRGYAGFVNREDITVRVSAAAEGMDAVRAAHRFSHLLGRQRRQLRAPTTGGQ